MKIPFEYTLIGLGIICIILAKTEKLNETESYINYMGRSRKFGLYLLGIVSIAATLIRLVADS